MERSGGEGRVVDRMGRDPVTDKLKSETYVKYLMGISWGWNKTYGVCDITSHPIPQIYHEIFNKTEINSVQGMQRSAKSSFMGGTRPDGVCPGTTAVWIILH